MFLLSVCSFCFSCLLECVNTIATPLYLYFQVLCQVLASNVRESKSYDLLSRKQIRYAPVKKKLKITKSSFWSEIFTQQALYNCKSFISFEFFDLSYRSARFYSSFTDCSVFPDFCLIIAFASFVNFVHGFLVGKTLNKVGEQ